MADEQSDGDGRMAEHQRVTEKESKQNGATIIYWVIAFIVFVPLWVISKQEFPPGATAGALRGFFATVYWFAIWAVVQKLKQGAGTRPKTSGQQCQTKHIEHLKKEGALKIERVPPAPSPSDGSFVQWWLTRSKPFRIWCFFSAAWLIIVFLSVLLFDPFDYGYRWQDKEIAHMLSIMFLPPLLIGGGKWVWDHWIVP